MTYRDDHPDRLAVDPSGCGCTECLIGEYVPLDQADNDDIEALLRGELADNSDSIWTVARDNWGQTTVACTGTMRVWAFTEPFPVLLNADGTAYYDSARAIDRARKGTR